MKYVFILLLLVVGAAAGAWGSAIVVRWNDNMTHTARIMPGERVFSMPPGVVSRNGDIIIPKEQRDVAAKQPNPMKASDASVAIGKERFATFCVPCHGAEGKGGTTGLVALRHGRSFVGCELNPDYVRLARDRIIADSPLLNTHAEVADAA